MRVFLAIEVPEALQGTIAARVGALRPRLPDARYTPAGKLHLTLHFFGERTPERVAEIGAALAPAVARHAPFTLRLAAAGSFPASRPRVLWLGLGPSRELEALHRDLNEVLGALGEEIETRPFRAHLTLARVKAAWRRDDLESLREGLRELADQSFSVPSLTLFESRLHPSGARYFRQCELALGARSGP